MKNIFIVFCVILVICKLIIYDNPIKRKITASEALTPVPVNKFDEFEAIEADLTASFIKNATVAPIKSAISEVHSATSPPASVIN